MLLVGTALILAGLLLGLVSAHVARRKAWDRPRFALTRSYAIGWGPARWVLLAAGLLCLARASVSALLAAAVLLAALKAWLVWVRSPSHALGRLRQELTALEARFPGAPSEDLVYRILRRWHPEWAPEVVQQIVKENPALKDVTRLVTRMERGWPF